MLMFLMPVKLMQATQVTKEIMIPMVDPMTMSITMERALKTARQTPNLSNKMIKKITVKQDITKITTTSVHHLHKLVTSRNRRFLEEEAANQKRIRKHKSKWHSMKRICHLMQI